jgi:hypothetical protein
MVYKCIIRLLSLIIGLNLIFLMIRLVFTKTNSTIKFHHGCCFYRFGLFIKVVFENPDVLLLFEVVLFIFLSFS